LCEGNKCKGGKPGRHPGAGRIHIFKRGKNQWERTAKIKLPKSVQFADYASIDLKADRVVVVSQEGSKIWVGELEKSSWDFVDEGRIYQFPSNAKGKPLYCNVEGVAWMSRSRIAVVSDKFKSDEQPARCCHKEQMIHIFDIPTG
jgi:hypothetical protein